MKAVGEGKSGAVEMLRFRGVFLGWLLFMVGLSPVNAADHSQIFVEKCGACHKRGSKVAPINPADKAGLVWVKYFQRKRHPVRLESTMSKKDMAVILEYLKEHSADSEVPVAAAIPK
jgi:hypothetical protein